MTWKNIRGTQ